MTFLITLGGSAAVFGWLVRGFWVKQVTPLVQEEIKKYQSDPGTINASKTAVVTDVAAWYDQRPQRENRQEEIRDALHQPKVRNSLEAIIHEKLDNEIKRSDGLIAKEVDTAVQRNLTGLREDLAKVTAFIQEDAHLKTQLLQRMARLEGTVSTFSGARVTSADSTAMPAVRDPNKR